MKKTFFLILFYVFILTIKSNAQWEVGPVGGVLFSDVVIEHIKVSTNYTINPTYGIMGTFLPERKKPGVKMILSQYRMGFEERSTDGNILYSNSGYSFQFLSYLYLTAKSFRFSIEAGPGISYLNLPKVSPNQDQSILPKYEKGNISRLGADLVGGIGLAQPLGKITISAYSLFSFSTAKIFKNYLGYSNPLTLQFSMGVQYHFIRKKSIIPKLQDL